MINYTPTPDYYNDYICHYNHNHDPRNGQFTSANGIIGGSEISNAEQAYKTLKKENIYEPNSSDDFKTDKAKERAREAADLGIIAAIATNRTSGDRAAEMKKDGARMWFLYEDQTIGLPTVADLALQGKTKEEIKNLKKLADQVDYEHSYEPGIFSLNEGHFEDEYIDKCIDIAKEYRKDKKHIDSTNVEDKTTTYGNEKYSSIDLGTGKSKINLFAFKDTIPDKKDFKREAKAFAMAKSEIKRLAMEAVKEDYYVKEWIREGNISENEFFRNLNIKQVSLKPNGFIEIGMWTDGKDYLGGHEINMEFYSYAPTKPRYISING